MYVSCVCVSVCNSFRVYLTKSLKTNEIVLGWCSMLVLSKLILGQFGRVKIHEPIGEGP